MFAAIVSAGGLTAGCGRLGFDAGTDPDAFRIHPSAGVVEVGESIELTVEGGEEPFEWTTTVGQLIGEASRRRAIVVDADVVVTVRDATGAIATAELASGEWETRFEYAGPTSWAYPTSIVSLADGRVITTMAVRQSSGEERWVVFGGRGADMLELDSFSLGLALPSLAAQVVPFAELGCVVVGGADSADGSRALVRGSTDCASFSTWDDYRPEASVATAASGVAVDSAGGVWVVGTTETVDDVVSFVRFSGDRGATWETRATLGETYARSIAIAPTGMMYILARNRSDASLSLFEASPDGTAWSEVDHYSPSQGIYFNGEGRPNLVASSDGSVYYQYGIEGGVNGGTRRFEPATRTTKLLATLDGGSHLGALASDPGMQSIYSTGRVAPNGTGTRAEVWVMRPGATDWAAQSTYQRGADEDSEGTALAVASDRSVWLAAWGWRQGVRAAVIRQLQ